MKKIKILIFGLTSLIGGVETYIINLVKNIDKERFEVDFLIQDEITGINKEKIQGCYHNIYKVENLKKHPIRAIKTLKKLYKENSYDVIHLNISTASSALYALPCKLFSRNTKIIIHSHNGGDKNKLQHYIFRKIINGIADERLACSKLAGQWMFGRKMVGLDKVIITNNAIETDRFLYNEEKRNKIRQELNLKESDFVIGHVGRFNPQKNHLGMIEFFEEAVRQDNSLKLMLLGTGELEKEIKEKVIQKGLDKNVIFLGVKSNINDYYQAMDIFILPSLFEGLPIVGIEAQASGLKCVFSDNVTREVDITGNVEFLSIEKPEEWKNCILNLKTAKNIRNNQKETIEQRGYDIKNQTKQIERIYEYKKEEQRGK